MTSASVVDYDRRQTGIIVSLDAHGNIQSVTTTSTSNGCVDTATWDGSTDTPTGASSTTGKRKGTGKRSSIGGKRCR